MTPNKAPACNPAALAPQKSAARLSPMCNTSCDSSKETWNPKGPLWLSRYPASPNEFPQNGPKWPHLTFKAFHPIAGLHLKLSKKGRTKGQINFNRWWQFQILVVVHACRGLGVLISPSPYTNAYRVSWMTSTEKCVSLSASLLSVCQCKFIGTSRCWTLAFMFHWSHFKTSASIQFHTSSRPVSSINLIQ